MEDLKRYLALAQETTSDAFAAQSDALFLVKRPRKQGIMRGAPAAIAFETQHTKLETDPYAATWRLVPVKKRAGNPYPDLISIGRAPNCDVVLRLPFVSKVHAHIQLNGPGTYSLRDDGASNGTFVNGRRIASKGTVPLTPGDAVSLGSFDLQFVDAAQLYTILRTEV